MSEASRKRLSSVILASVAASAFHVTKASIAAGRDRRVATPSQARHFLDTLRGLFRWALDAEHVKTDPTHGVADPRRAKMGGFPIWTEEHVEAYARRWPVGTRQRVWLDVLLFTGLRRGDAVRLGRQHVKDGIATILTEKSGFTIEVSIQYPHILIEMPVAGESDPVKVSIIAYRRHPRSLP
jgi:site-specific recombinase XerD